MWLQPEQLQPGVGAQCVCKDSTLMGTCACLDLSAILLLVKSVGAQSNVRCVFVSKVESMSEAG
jgi:hypothetical protein